MKCTALGDPRVAGGALKEFLAVSARRCLVFADLLKMANRLNELSDQSQVWSHRPVHDEGKHDYDSED